MRLHAINRSLTRAHTCALPGEVYDRIVAADTDNTGEISVRELYDFIRSMSNEVKEASKGGIPISSLDPDTDGDGKVEKWEMEVFERIKAADEDKSGSIDVKELFGVIKGAAESDKQKRLFARMLVVAVLVIFALIGAMLGMGIVAGEAVKESHISGGHHDSATTAATTRRLFDVFGAQGRYLSEEDEITPKPEPTPAAMTNKAGDAVVQTAAVESTITLFDMPLVLEEYGERAMTKLERLTFFVDMSSAPTPSWQMTSVAISGYSVDVADATVATLVSPSAHAVVINARTRTGTVTFGGMTYPITDELPEEVERRRLEEAAEREPMRPIKLEPAAAPILDVLDASSKPEGVGRRQLRRAGRVSIRRMKGARFGIASTSGNFQMRVGFQGNH